MNSDDEFNSTGPASSTENINSPQIIELQSQPKDIDGHFKENKFSHHIEITKKVIITGNGIIIVIYILGLILERIQQSSQLEAQWNQLLLGTYILDFILKMFVPVLLIAFGKGIKRGLTVSDLKFPTIGIACVFLWLIVYSMFPNTNNVIIQVFSPFTHILPLTDIGLLYVLTLIRAAYMIKIVASAVLLVLSKVQSKTIE